MWDRLYPLLSVEWTGLLCGLVLLIVFGLSAWRLFPRPVSWVLAIGAVLGLAMSAGALRHLGNLSELRAALPPPGEMVDVGGYALHVLAEGPETAITIVSFGGGHSPGLAMMGLHNALKEDARSVLIDRPGTGWSDVGPFPRSTAREVEEVMAALAAAGERGPYLFVGHSFGGLLAANIARRYPDDAAGVVLMDATPIDIAVYGLDQDGLGSLEKMERKAGLKRLIGWYEKPTMPVAGDGENPALSQPMAVVPAFGIRAGVRFAGASIYEELSARSVVDRLWETAIFDGDLSDTPLYLIAPTTGPDIMAYANMVAGEGTEDAVRFYRLLSNTRERYMASSNRSQRIIAPEGSGHNFPYTEPDFTSQTVLTIFEELQAEL